MNQNSDRTECPANTHIENESNPAANGLALPPPTKYSRQCRKPDQSVKCKTNFPADERHQQFLAAHRAVIARTILQDEPAHWTSGSGLSDAWMWDLHGV